MIHKDLKTAKFKKPSHGHTHTYSQPCKNVSKKNVKKSRGIPERSVYPESNLVVNETCRKHCSKKKWIMPKEKQKNEKKNTTVKSSLVNK